jgi:hypothetical protein
MRDLSTSWPKLAGGFVGLSIAGLTLWEVREWWGRFQLWRDGRPGARPMVFTEWLSLILFPEWVLLLITIIFLFLGYFLYRARDWARRTVTIVLSCLGSLVFFSITIKAVQDELQWQSRLLENTPMTLEFRIGQVFAILAHMGWALVFLAPYAFFVCALCHRDVAAAFRRGATKRSNQSLQPTAGRCESTLNDDL